MTIVKLQAQRTRKVGEKIYYHWFVNLPPTLIGELEWSKGTELKIIRRKDMLIIRKFGNRKN